MFLHALRFFDVKVYASGSGIEPGWSAFIALVAVFIVSCFVRFARDDRCIICGHHLIWFRKASPIGGGASKIVIIVVSSEGGMRLRLCEPCTLTARLGGLDAWSGEVFMQGLVQCFYSRAYMKMCGGVNACLTRSILGLSLAAVSLSVWQGIAVGDGSDDVVAHRSRSGIDIVSARDRCILPFGHTQETVALPYFSNKS